MFKVDKKGVVGIDLAAKESNPTGWAFLKGRLLETCLIYMNSEILEKIASCSPSIVAIDAPLSLPKKGPLRKSDKEMMRRGLHVIPPSFSAMQTLTLRAMELSKLIADKGHVIIEVHPTSTRKVLKMPAKNWKEIQNKLRLMGLTGEINKRELSPHEIDAATAALTAHLYVQGQTENVGNKGEGYIVIPKGDCWRTISL
ncbi:MAG: DUF429 domain-containing protein [Candidatus Bathyarchaeia archaeon]